MSGSEENKDVEFLKNDAEVEGGEVSSDVFPTVSEDILASSESRTSLDTSEIVLTSSLRSGDDLILMFESGEREVVEDYYSPDFSETSVEVLGRSFDVFALRVLLSQSSDDVTRTTVGEIAKLEGDAYVVDVLGVKRTVQEGDDIFFGEEVILGEEASLSLTMNDESSITLSSGARMVIDSHAFDEGAVSGNESLFSLLKGTFLYLSGKVAQQDYDNVGLVTPVGTIGIRGTSLIADVGDGEDMDVVLLSGAIQVSGDGGSRLFDEAFSSLTLGEGGFTSVGKADADALAKKFASLFNAAGSKNLEKIAQELKSQGFDSDDVSVLLEELESGEEGGEEEGSGGEEGSEEEGEGSEEESEEEEEESDEEGELDGEGDVLSGKKEAEEKEVKNGEKAEKVGSVEVMTADTGVVVVNTTSLLDFTPPDAPRISLVRDTGREDGVTSDKSVAFEVEPGSTLVVYDGSGNEVVREKAGAGGRLVVNFQLTGDGQYTYTAKAIDEAENESELSEFTFTYDTKLPEVPLEVSVEGVGSAYRVTQEKKPSFNVKVLAEEVGNELVVLRNGVEVGRGLVGEGGVTLISTDSGGESSSGLKTYEFYVIDGAGNEGSRSNLLVTHDYTPPAELSKVVVEGYSAAIGKTGVNLINKVRPKFQVEGEEFSRVEVVVDGKVVGRVSELVVGVNDVELDSGVELGVAGEDRDVKVTFRLTDRAGNVSEDEYTLKVDRKAPDAPGVELEDGDRNAGDLVVNGKNPTFKVSGEEGAKVALTLVRIDAGGEVSVSVGEVTISGGSASWTVPQDLGSVTEDDVRYKLKVKQTDVAGNESESESEVEFTVDRKSPENLVFSFAEDTTGVLTTGNTTPTIYLSGGVEGDRVVVTIDGNSAEGVIDAGGKLSLTWGYGLGEAKKVTDHTVEVVITDRAGNTTLQGVRVTIDLQAANVSGDSLVFYEIKGSVEEEVTDGVVRLDSGTDKFRVKLSVNDTERGGSVKVIAERGGVEKVLTIDGGSLIAGVSTAQRKIDLEFDVSFSGGGWKSGDYDIFYRVIDRYGNESNNSFATTLRFDDEAPVKPTVVIATAQKGDFVKVDDVKLKATVAKDEGTSGLEETYKSLIVVLKDGLGNEIGRDSMPWSSVTKIENGDSFVIDLSGGVLNGLVDGSYKVSVIAVDKAERETESTDISFGVDTTAPPKPTLSLLKSDDTADADGVSGSDSPKLKLDILSGESHPDDLVWQVRNKGDTAWRTIKTDDVPASSTWDAKDEGDINFVDGIYEFRVLFSDDAGNETISDTLEVTVDTTDPGPLTLDHTNVDSTVYAQGVSVPVDVTKIEAGATLKTVVSVISADGSAVGGWTDVEIDGVELAGSGATSGKLNVGALWTALSSLAGGQYKVTVTISQTDEGDNLSPDASVTFDIDTQVPTGTIVQKDATLVGGVFTPSVEDAGNDYNISVLLSGLDAGDKVVAVKNGVVMETFTILNGKLTISKSLADDSGVKLYLQDDAGNRANNGIPLDVTPPANDKIELSLSSIGQDYNQVINATFKADSDVAWVKVIVDDGVIRDEKVFSLADAKDLLGTGKTLSDLLSNLGGISERGGGVDQLYTIKLEAYDKYGNKTVDVDTGTIHVDSVRPSAVNADSESGWVYKDGPIPVVSTKGGTGEIALTFTTLETRLDKVIIRYKVQGDLAYKDLRTGVDRESTPIDTGSGTYKVTLNNAWFDAALGGADEETFLIHVVLKDTAGNESLAGNDVTIKVDNEAPFLPSSVLFDDVSSSAPSYYKKESDTSVLVAKDGHVRIKFGDVSDIGVVKIGLFDTTDAQVESDVTGVKFGASSYDFDVNIPTLGTYTVKFKVTDKVGNESVWLEPTPPLNVEVIDSITSVDFSVAAVETVDATDLDGTYEVTWTWGDSNTLANVKSVQLQQFSGGIWSDVDSEVSPTGTSHTFTGTIYVVPGTTVDYRVVVKDVFDRTTDGTLISVASPVPPIELGDLGQGYIQDTGKSFQRADGVTTSSFVYFAFPTVTRGNSELNTKIGNNEIFLKVTVEYKEAGDADWSTRTFYKQVKTADVNNSNISFDLRGDGEYFLGSSTTGARTTIKVSDIFSSLTQFRNAKVQLRDEAGYELNSEKSVSFALTDDVPYDTSSWVPPSSVNTKSEITYDNTAPRVDKTVKFSDDTTSSAPSFAFVYTKGANPGAVERDADLVIRIPKTLEFDDGENQFDDLSYVLTLAHRPESLGGVPADDPADTTGVFYFGPDSVDVTGTALVFRIPRETLDKSTSEGGLILIDATKPSYELSDTSTWEVTDFKVFDAAGNEIGLHNDFTHSQALGDSTKAGSSQPVEKTALDDVNFGIVGVSTTETLTFSREELPPVSGVRGSKDIPFSYDAPESTGDEQHYFSHYYKATSGSVDANEDLRLDLGDLFSTESSGSHTNVIVDIYTKSSSGTISKIASPTVTSSGGIVDIKVSAAMANADEVYIEVSLKGWNIHTSGSGQNKKFTEYYTPKVLFVLDNSSVSPSSPSVHEGPQEDSFVYRADEEEDVFSHDDVSLSDGEGQGELISFSEDSVVPDALSETPDTPSGDGF